MSISKETQEKINVLFETNSEMREKLYKCDPDAIREIGYISQSRIDPSDVIVAYESGDPSTMNNVYQQAKRLVELQELYKELCLEYYEKTDDTSESVEHSNSQKTSI